MRGQPAEQRRDVRAERSRVIVDDLRQHLDARNRQVSAKSKLCEAIRYALTRWDGLSRFLDDGRIDLDSNVVERSIRPLALNRKNALFAGSGPASADRSMKPSRDQHRLALQLQIRTLVGATSPSIITASANPGAGRSGDPASANASRCLRRHV